MRLKIALFAIAMCLGFSTSTNAKKSVYEELFVYDPAGLYLPILREAQELTLDHRNSEGYEVYGPQGTMLWLDRLGIPYIQQIIPKNLSADYPSSAEVAAKIHEIANRFPEIMHVEEIGRSVQGQPLLVVKVSDNPQVDEIEPEAKYISSMHGNEIAGRDVLLLFLEYLGEQYSQNDSIRALVDNTELYLMPSMNPDGSDRRQRGNANWTDLNRDFPDFTTSDNQNTVENREPETVAVMLFQASRNFALSANFHGGAEVVNYPWDTMSDRHPFDALIRGLSQEYANSVPYLRESTRFPGGITNGYDWYTLDGGMQDWSYYWHNDLQVTIEISGYKWPDYSQIPYYFETNRDAMLGYLASVHQGAGFSIPQANISGEVEIFQGSRSLGVYVFQHSEFYKVLPPGEYEFEIRPDGRPNQNTSITMRVSSGVSENNGNYLTLRLE